MYSKEEFQTLKLNFWSGLEEYLKKAKNPHGSKVNWMKYNTKIKNLYFRMEVDENGARLCIDLQHRDPGIRSLLWEQFLEYEQMLNKLFENNLIWQETFEHPNGLQISRISLEDDSLSLLNREDWKTIYAFQKKNFTKLNRFWYENQDLFRALMN